MLGRHHLKFLQIELDLVETDLRRWYKLFDPKSHEIQPILRVMEQIKEERESRQELRGERFSSSFEPVEPNIKSRIIAISKILSSALTIIEDFEKTSIPIREIQERLNLLHPIIFYVCSNYAEK